MRVASRMNHPKKAEEQAPQGERSQRTFVDCPRCAGSKRVMDFQSGDRATARLPDGKLPCVLAAGELATSISRQPRLSWKPCLTYTLGAGVLGVLPSTKFVGSISIRSSARGISTLRRPATRNALSLP